MITALKIHPAGAGLWGCFAVIVLDLAHVRWTLPLRWIILPDCFHTGRMLGFWFFGPSEVAPIVAVVEVISNQCS
jgi:hypothetical protein